MSESLQTPEAKPVSASRVVMTQLVLPSHTNSLGSIFGGVIMSWIDICGAIAAQRHSNHTVVTASLDDVHFFKPVYLGWIVNLRASVNFVAKTSMEVGVRVDSENPKTGENIHTASAYMTFVALGDDGKPCIVAPTQIATEDDRRRYGDALRRRDLRLKRRAISQMRGT